MIVLQHDRQPSWLACSVPALFLSWPGSPRWRHYAIILRRLHFFWRENLRKYFQRNFKSIFGQIEENIILKVIKYIEVLFRRPNSYGSMLAALQVEAVNMRDLAVYWCLCVSVATSHCDRQGQTGADVSTLCSGNLTCKIGYWYIEWCYLSSHDIINCIELDLHCIVIDNHRQWTVVLMISSRWIKCINSNFIKWNRVNSQ